MREDVARKHGFVKLHQRDQEWAAMYQVAERMTAKYERQVKAVTRRRGFRVIQGLALGKTALFEPVRERRVLANVGRKCSRSPKLHHGSDRCCEGMARHRSRS
jgi:hypothetical protein